MSTNTADTAKVVFGSLCFVDMFPTDRKCPRWVKWMFSMFLISLKVENVKNREINWVAFVTFRKLTTDFVHVTFSSLSLKTTLKTDRIRACIREIIFFYLFHQNLFCCVHESISWIKWKMPTVTFYYNEARQKLTSSVLKNNLLINFISFELMWS